MHVVVLGAGYAGLTLTRLLEERLPDTAELTLINDEPDHLVQHELHRVIRRPELASAITVSLPAVLERATVRIAHVEEIDRESRTISLSSGTLSYDVAAICLGAQTAYYGLEGVREHATPLKSLADAMAIRQRALEVFAQPDGHIVIGGAGLSGVQTAGELAVLAREERADVTITLLEQLESVAPAFPDNFQQAVRDALEAQGIEVRTGTAVLRADSERVVLESGERLPAAQFVWTGGIRGPDALSGERPAVESDLRLDERTFALGDAAAVTDADGEPVPASAQAAVREARTASTAIARVVTDELEAATATDSEQHVTDSGEHVADDGEEQTETPESFSFDSPGWLVSVGDDAVAQLGPAVVTGRTAKALKTTVGLGYLSAIGGLENASGRAYREFIADRVRDWSER
ncbi:FAD-dependent oxidoreductase [Natronolimnobius sp. AArcel1]|uniref:NAD(P)/FAD-dependent oxidoreductase n=1 Tax=Natronolimnobius sp. AArcel1 TaxID=1679093 RepID=UPI0013EB359E|nr:FAD-dependent oxidoreductase [Natronolimnobius sp. AArcel1]NGM69954.1 FAD-dependent oxidoreductase [Natronolimnobius sp. AArcel1]